MMRFGQEMGENGMTQVENKNVEQTLSKSIFASAPILISRIKLTIHGPLAFLQ